MLAALLLTGIVAAPLSSAALFLSTDHYGRSAGRWPAVRRFVLALLGTVVLAAIVAGVLRMLGTPLTRVLVAGAALIFASLVWLPGTRRWNARAHLCWVSSVFLFVAYLTFVLDWTFASHLGAASTGRSRRTTSPPTWSSRP